MFLTEKPQAIITACAQTWYIYFYSTVLSRFPFTEGNFQPHHKPLNLPPCSLRQNKLPSQFNTTLSSAAQQTKTFSFGASDNQRDSKTHTALQPEPEVFFRHAAGAEKAARTARGSSNSQVLWDTGKVDKTLEHHVDAGLQCLFWGRTSHLCSLAILRCFSLISWSLWLSSKGTVTEIQVLKQNNRKHSRGQHRNGSVQLTPHTAPNELDSLGPDR